MASVWGALHEQGGGGGGGRDAKKQSGLRRKQTPQGPRPARATGQVGDVGVAGGQPQGVHGDRHRFFFFNNAPPPEISPLPLPAALPILTAIGVSQVLQIVAALSGSAASFQDGRIDFGLAAWVALFELAGVAAGVRLAHAVSSTVLRRSEEHTSELQSPCNLVCRLLLEKK